MKILNLSDRNSSKVKDDAQPVDSQLGQVDDEIQSVVAFDQPVILEQPAIWSRLFVWLIIGIAVSAVTWAYFAKVEQAVPAVGKLEPKGALKEVKAPTGGVVREIAVEEGQQVKKDQVLITLDSTAPQADLESLRTLRESLLKENQLYTAALNGEVTTGGGPELEALARLRATLVSENQFLQAQAEGLSNLASGGGGAFDANQQQLLSASRAEYESRVEAARSRIQSLQQQLLQVQEQIPKAQGQLEVARGQIPKAQSQLQISQQQLQTTQTGLPIAREQLETARQTLALNEQILNRISPLVQQGAISALQQERQQQEVFSRQAEVLTRQNEISVRETEILNRQNEISAREAELLNRQNDVISREAELDRLRREDQRLQAEISGAREQLANTMALSDKDIRTKIADNQKRVADIDSQLSRSKLENQKRIAQIDGELAKAQLQLQYQQLKSPVDGVVFDLQPSSPGFVANSSEPIVKIIPTGNLNAVVYLKNQDIAIVSNALNEAKAKGEKGVPVDLNIEAFPTMEYGTVEGTLITIASDVLEPTQERPFYSFRAIVELKNQSFILDENTDFKIPLKSGMAVQSTIKIGKRTVLEIFMNRFTNKVKSIETVK